MYGTGIFVENCEKMKLIFLFVNNLKKETWHWHCTNEQQWTIKMLFVVISVSNIILMVFKIFIEGIVDLKGTGTFSLYIT